ncbi:MAG: ATPase, T2SS/T4P/T4SS family, partial [Candidatus Sumerlaeota bacterium]
HTTYGVNFVSAIEHGAWLACQFHPELSGNWGLQLLKNWLSLAPERTPEAFEKREEKLPEVIDRFVQLLFKQAIHDGASEILFSHEDSRLIIRFRTKGVLEAKPSPPYMWGPHIVGKLKELAEIIPGTNATEQVGEFALVLPDRKLKMRATFSPSHDRESVSILINPESDLPC